ncbi:hypothetical protein SAMN05444169_6431 [Bradyrhizobium erythrophlei]|jgi:hypothetical protein|uniref:Uncharacterized protein n=2 Tax=Bradyrhizobium erythrophlei TaxID=1437360 RepID=A0A1M5RAX3_9BRAD|nr:hypothetical protein SAMN05444169_6431 [Bradyrhizobium erythrophlei]
MHITNRRLRVIWRMLALVGFSVCACAITALCQTINNTGFCNIINQGSNNKGIYIQYCNASGVPKVDLLDPPLLWLGMDIPTLMSFVGARNPTVLKDGGLTTIVANGTLFGLSGNTKYGFDAQGKLASMSVENQCTETRDDYLLKTQPPDLHPSWLEWRNSPDYRLSYEKTTQCSQIFEVSKTLVKLFGSPAEDKTISHVGRVPSTSEICAGITSAPQQPCSNTGALRSTYIQNFIGPDRLTGIGVVTRELMMHGEVQKGSYYPRVWRREIVGVVSVWGPAGRPEPTPSVYGAFRFYLGAELP